MDILVYEHILGEEFSDKSSSLILHEAILIAKFLIAIVPYIQRVACRTRTKHFI